MTEKHSRTYNSIVNSAAGIAASAITVLLNFLVRVYLVRELGEEINGIHNLFYSIANVMVLMELGIGSAMIIHLYEPIKQENKDSVKAILHFYKRIYRIVAVVFLIVGLLVDFFLIDKLVESSIDVSIVRRYFFLFIISYVVNYLTCYKKSVLFAEQKNRISMLSSAFCEIIYRTLQIVLIIYWHNYELFLILLILEKLTTNIICNVYVNKNHPYLKEKGVIPISEEKKKAIYNTVKPLMVNQIAGTAQNSSQSILISILLGNVAIVGYFGNYNLLISVVYLVYSQFGAAITSSFGNLSVDGNAERLQAAYKRSAFVMDWFACVCCAVFMACSDKFIYLVFGENFVLDRFSVIVLTLNMLVYLINIPIVSLQNAMGLHRLDSKYMVVQAFLAISIAYFFGKWFGMVGILSGLLLPTILFTLLRKGVVISSNALNMKSKDYLVFILMEISKVILCLIVTWFVCNKFFPTNSISNLIGSAILAILISLLLPYFFSFRTKEFNELLPMVQGVVNKKMRKEDKNLDKE